MRADAITTQPRSTFSLRAIARAGARYPLLIYHIRTAVPCWCVMCARDGVVRALLLLSRTATARLYAREREEKVREEMGGTVYCIHAPPST